MKRFTVFAALLCLSSAAPNASAATPTGGILGRGEARCRIARLFSERLPLYTDLFYAMGATDAEWAKAKVDAKNAATSICQAPDLYLATPSGFALNGFLSRVGQRQAQALGMTQPEGDAHVLNALESETSALRRECSIETDPARPNWMSPKTLFEANFKQVAVGTCDKDKDPSRAFDAAMSGRQRQGVTSCLARFAGAAKNSCNDPRAASGPNDPPAGWGTTEAKQGPPDKDTRVEKDPAGNVTKTETWKGADSSTYVVTTKTDAKGVVTYAETSGADSNGRNSYKYVLRDDKAKNEAQAKKYQDKANDLKPIAAALATVGVATGALGGSAGVKALGVFTAVVGSGIGGYTAYLDSLAAKERNKRCLSFDTAMPNGMSYREAGSKAPINTNDALRACMCQDRQAGTTPTRIEGARTSPERGGILASMTKCPSPEDAQRLDCMGNLYGRTDAPRKECLDLLRRDNESTLAGFRLQRMCGLTLCRDGTISQETSTGCACLPSSSSREHPEVYGGTACERIRCEDSQICECTQGGTCGCKAPFTRVPGLCEGEPCPIPGRPAR